MGFDASEPLDGSENRAQARPEANVAAPDDNSADGRGAFRRLIGMVLVVYVAALFTGTHVPLPQLEQLPQHSDKWLHTLAYAGLAWLIGLWVAARRELCAVHYLAVFGVCVAYSAFDEFLQIFVGRHADVYDGLADALGSVIGLAALVATLATLKRVFRRLA